MSHDVTVLSLKLYYPLIRRDCHMPADEECRISFSQHWPWAISLIIPYLLHMIGYTQEYAPIDLAIGTGIVSKTLPITQTSLTHVNKDDLLDTINMYI